MKFFIPTCLLIKSLRSSILPSIFNYCILLFLLFPSLYTYSQEYVKFNFQDGIWIEEEYSKDSYTINRQLYCKDDTIIDAQLYKMLFESTININYPGGYPDTTMHKYTGAIRENDSKQIIFRSVSDTGETVIYDFNIQIGDTIKLFEEENIIYSIDSIEVCGKIRKKYLVIGPSYSEYLIEGIGYSTGLLGYFYNGGSNGESYNRTECYSERNNPSCSDCSLILSQNVNDYSFVIFPNPASSKIVIKAPKSIQSINMVDLMNRVLYSNVNVNSTNYLINLGNYKSGCYIVRITFSDKTSQSKLIYKIDQ